MFVSLPLIVEKLCAIFQQSLTRFCPFSDGHRPIRRGKRMRKDLSHMFIISNLCVFAHTHAVNLVNITLLT